MGVPVPTTTPYWLLGRLAVDHRASIISMDFGALDFISPKRNRLAYRMAGLTDQWIDIGSQHRITLTNLDAGDHELEVRAANADSVWSENTAASHDSQGAGAVEFAVGLRRLRTSRSRGTRLPAAIATHEIPSRSSRRGSASNPRSRCAPGSWSRAIDSWPRAARAKSNFLDRMSHELRTPMNGVVGMTELLARTPLSSTQTRLMETIRSSARVLLQIVNDLLDLSKIQAGKVQLESLPIDLIPLLEECTSLFFGQHRDERHRADRMPDSARPAGPHRRSAAPAADSDEPDRQRRQIHGAGRSRGEGRHSVHRAGPRDAANYRLRHRSWNGRGDDREDLRAVSRRRMSRPPAASAAADSGSRSAGSSLSYWRHDYRDQHSQGGLDFHAGIAAEDRGRRVKSTATSAAATAARANTHASAGAGRSAVSHRVGTGVDGARGRSRSPSSRDRRRGIRHRGRGKLPGFSPNVRGVPPPVRLDCGDRGVGRGGRNRRPRKHRAP